MISDYSTRKKVSGVCLQNRIFNRFCFLHLFTGTLFLFLLFAPTVYGGGSLSDNEMRELYIQGTEFFHRAAEKSKSDPAVARELYEKAILRYEHLVEEGGVRNGKLFYNIGNIYFLLEDVGGAILNYRRAEHFIPNDHNLVKNLAYARSLRQDKLEIKDQRKILQTLFFFHYDLKTTTRLVIFGAFYLAFWLFAAIKIFSQRPYTSWILAVTLVFSLFFGGSLFIEGSQAGRNMGGVILDLEVIARQGDAESYQPSFEAPLHNGTEFILLEDRGAWWQIELPDGRSSWIPARSGELVGLDY